MEPQKSKIERNWNKISNNDTRRHYARYGFGRLPAAARKPIGSEEKL
jgi:hypothetical protein